MMVRPFLTTASLAVMLSAAARAQIDEARAQGYFEEIAQLCAREGGVLWGRSLDGPIVVADPQTGEIATNRPVPEAPRPRMLGFANAALMWGEDRWSILVWQTLPHDDAHARQRMIAHELFHRIQFDLELMTPDGDNSHLDTPDGRYWLQLEWRALAAALEAEDSRARAAAISHALGFRAARRTRFPGSSEQERREEIREGLAQYTGTVVVCGSGRAAALDVCRQIEAYAKEPTFVRTFGYPSGAAYGVLLDIYSEDWRQSVTSASDLGDMLANAANVQPHENPQEAAGPYGGQQIRAAEKVREELRMSELAELRQKFIDGPVLRMPDAPGSFRSVGVTPLPGEGTVFPAVRVTAEWGSLVAERAFRTADRATLVVPAPQDVERPSLSGEGWTLALAEGWAIKPGPREGDFVICRDDGAP